MREDDSDWLSRWEEELPRPEDLTPLSQTLITPDLALAFGIQPQSQPQIHPIANRHVFLHHHQQQNPSPAAPPTPGLNPGSGDFDSSSELGGGGSGSGGDETARTLKRPRLVWTPQLHKRFVDAVAHLGIKNAVPKTIMQLMSVDGLTRENVASHLQKYRLYLKRMQGLSAGGPALGSGDPATDHLFASSPVPAHFLHPQAAVGPVGGARQSSEYYMGYAPPPSPAAAMAAMVAGGQYHHRHQFDHPFLSRQPHMGVRIGAGGGVGVGVVQNSVGGYVMDDVVESGQAANGRRVLTLFPTGHD